MAPEQLDSALLPKRFLALFPQRFGSTFRATTGTAWRAMSQYHYLEDDSILASLGGSSKNIRACLLDKKTSFLVLTCVTGDDGIDLEDAKLVVEQLRHVGFKPCIYKEAGSNSIQIFLAFSEPVETDYAAKAIASFLKNKATKLHDTETAFVMPLQQGFAWLNNDLSNKVECDCIAVEAAMAMFLHDLDSNSVSSELLEPLAANKLDAEESSCSISSLILDAVELEAVKVEELDVQVAVEQSVQADPDIEIQKPAETNIPPAEVPAVSAQVPVPGGQQLLLFPVTPQIVQLEHPKERPKRKKRARSDLPADTQSEVYIPTLFTALPIDALGVLQPLKEAPDD
jgi:hypothetical protein